MSKQAKELQAYSLPEQMKLLIPENSLAVQMAKRWQEVQRTEQESIRRMLEPLQDIRSSLLKDSAIQQMLEAGHQLVNLRSPLSPHVYRLAISDGEGGDGLRACRLGEGIGSFANRGTAFHTVEAVVVEDPDSTVRILAKQGAGVVVDRSRRVAVHGFPNVDLCELTTRIDPPDHAVVKADEQIAGLILGYAADRALREGYGPSLVVEAPQSVAAPDPEIALHVACERADGIDLDGFRAEVARPVPGLVSEDAVLGGKPQLAVLCDRRCRAIAFERSIVAAGSSTGTA
jgi:hypothetical protein